MVNFEFSKLQIWRNARNCVFCMFPRLTILLSITSFLEMIFSRGEIRPRTKELLCWSAGDSWRLVVIGVGEGAGEEFQSSWYKCSVQAGSRPSVRVVWGKALLILRHGCKLGGRELVREEAEEEKMTRKERGKQPSNKKDRSFAMGRGTIESCLCMSTPHLASRPLHGLHLDFSKIHGLCFASVMAEKSPHASCMAAGPCVRKN